MSAGSCGVAETCLWNWKEEKLSLEKKNSLQALGFSDTLGQRKGLLSAPCYCLSWGRDVPYSAPCLEAGLSCDQMQTFSMWDWMHTLHAVQDTDKSLLRQCAALLQQESAVKSTQCLISWYFSILPCKFPLWFMLCHTCFWNTFFPSIQTVKNAVVKGRGLQEENWVFSGSSVWMKRSCMCFQDAADLEHWCLLRGK